jgi:hypothetical protein
MIFDYLIIMVLGGIGIFLSFMHRKELQLEVKRVDDKIDKSLPGSLVNILELEVKLKELQDLINEDFHSFSKRIEHLEKVEKARSNKKKTTSK